MELGIVRRGDAGEWAVYLLKAKLLMKASLLTVVLLFAGCSSAQLETARIDPALAALVPGDTILLSGVRMAELRSTPLYKKLASQQSLSSLDDFAKKTNFDPRKDVNAILIASDGVDNVVLARGNFKPQPPAGLKQSTYKGVTIYGQAEGAYAILDSSTAVAGADRAVRKAIDQKQSGRPGATALLDRARSLPGSPQIWLVASGWGKLPEDLGRQGGNISNFGRLFQSIENLSATVDLRSGIAAVINGMCRTEQDAKSISDTVRGFVALGRLSVPEKQPELLRVFDGIKVEQQQKSVLLNVQIPADLVDQLVSMASPARPAH
jgi:hypothetical protein